MNIVQYVRNCKLIKSLWQMQSQHSTLDAHREQRSKCGTHVWSFKIFSTLLLETDQMKMEPFDEPAAMYCPSGLKHARVQSWPTLKPSAL